MQAGSRTIYRIRGTLPNFDSLDIVMGDIDPNTEDVYTLCGENNPCGKKQTIPNAELVCALLEDRQEYLEYHVPPIRVELQPSPYPEFTAYQLNMRRKAEILAYKSKDGVDGSPTKSQKWAYLAKTSRQLSLKTNKCANRDLTSFLSPTSSCDVPGPVILLYKDKSVPLYNYGATPTYNLVNAPKKEEFKSFPKYDMEFLESQYNYLLNLVIEVPNSRFYTFMFQTPFSLKIAGIIHDSGTPVNSIQFSVAKSNFAVYYAGVLITTINPIIHLETKPAEISLLYSFPGEFDATMFMGFINGLNIRLQTQQQYVYDFKMSFSFNYVLFDANGDKIDPASSNISISDISLIANLTDTSDPNYLNYNNCIVQTLSPYPFSPFVFGGKTS
jgi:hypothetical protein